MITGPLELAKNSRPRWVFSFIFHTGYSERWLLAFLLRKKLRVAVPERNAQKASFEAFSEKQTEHIAEWKLMIENWESDQSQPTHMRSPNQVRVAM